MKDLKKRRRAQGEQARAELLVRVFGIQENIAAAGHSVLKAGITSLNLRSPRTSRCEGNNPTWEWGTHLEKHGIPAFGGKG